MISSPGLEIIPRETISVVAPADGWLIARRTRKAPVVETERARCQGSWPENGLDALRTVVLSTCYNERPVTADETDGVAKRDISRA